MKFGFSTLCCPGWGFSDITAAASDIGFDGIELRGVGNGIYLPRVKDMSDANLPNVKAELKRLKLDVPCLTTGAFLFDSSLADSAKNEVRDYIRLAVKLGAAYIRVLGDRDPWPGAVDEQSVRDNLRELLPEAEKAGITLLVETNGVYADSEKLRALCEEINHPSLGVLWDVHHPFRYLKEKPGDTYSNLSKFIKHVHFKDSVMIGGKASYRMTGYGDLPLKEMLHLLKDDGYNGFVVLEWVKRWNMDLEEADVVLPHFLDAVKRML